MRKNADGSDRPHPLNDPRFRGATILFSGANFGCGSSREHAPQAIQKHGFRAVVAEGFAEIFFGNCVTLGIPCFTASREDIAQVTAAIAANPALEITADVAMLPGHPVWRENDQGVGPGFGARFAHQRPLGCHRRAGRRASGREGAGREAAVYGGLSGV